MLVAHLMFCLRPMDVQQADTRTFVYVRGRTISCALSSMAKASWLGGVTSYQGSSFSRRWISAPRGV
ncbi:hypothetical protein MUK42_36000 [Musa troglodytarum]|uniref:Uncharacterized protein n=1 Tax=Musa troglodytarum TaxID=320322 RepID=A0A9E7KDE3_9LILI|nr:hypothetical protein MUK42_36000 [Musa troglodytarum]